MLHRRQDNTFEFRDIERALYSIQPPALSRERKDALRDRIMSSLGEQEALRQAGILTPVFRERWIAVPAGVGLAVAIIAGIRAYEAYGPTSGNGSSETTFAGELSLGGSPVDELRPGPTFVASTAANVHLGNEVVLMLQRGASFSYRFSGSEMTVEAAGGSATVVTGARPVHVVGEGWSARLGVDSAAQFAVSASVVSVVGKNGVVSVTDRNSQSHALEIDEVLTITIGGGLEPGPTPPVEPSNSNGAPSGNSAAPAVEPEEDQAANEPAAPPSVKPGNKPTQPPGASHPVIPTNPPPAPATPDTSTPAPNASEPAAPADTQGPPEDVPAPIVPPGHGGEIPGDPAGGGAPENAGNGNGEPPSDPPGGGQPDDPGANGNRPGSNNGNGNGSENGTGPGSSNGHGNGNGNGNGNHSMTSGEGDSQLPFSSEAETGDNGSAEPVHNGNGNANGHAHAPGQQEDPAPSSNGNGNGNSSPSNNGNAATNPGQGKGPVKK